MTSFDKIAILWIDDIPESGHPERGLGVYDPFFEVVCKDDAGKNDSLKSIEDFNQLLKAYLSSNANDSVFPVELVAIDYDLSTYNPSGKTAGQFDVHDASDADEGDSGESGPQLSFLSAKYEAVDFDGFLIGSIYAAHFRLHPAGMVATTYQSKRMGPTVRQLESTLKMCYDVDIEFAGKKRTWKNILEAGVRRLRSRIECLYYDHRIVISIGDLIALAANPDHEVVTIQSRFGTRRLPVQGLFIDVPEQERSKAIQAWVDDLQNHVISKEGYVAANELAKTVWDAYNNTQLIEERGQLSALLAPLRDWLSVVSNLEPSLKDANPKSYKAVCEKIKRLGPLITQVKACEPCSDGDNTTSVAERLLGIKEQAAEVFRLEHAANTPALLADKISGMVHRELVALVEVDKVHKLKDRCKTFATPNGLHGHCGTDKCCDLFAGEYSDLVRRWAAILIIKRLVERVLNAKKHLERRFHDLTGEDGSEINPTIMSNDVYLALYPIPESPSVFAWHGGENIDTSHNWMKNLLALNDESLPLSTGGKKRGNLALRISDVLAGRGWNEEAGTFGLRPIERHFLRGLVMKEEEDWQGHVQARSILNGEEKEKVLR
ncbi:MAG: hypothetical protein HQ567_29555 [Candidatus Nealsonbacteria bacterium]|nr:hypothetical protein [Candidatus Nealsonbacteria bacterium]